ncbi:MAG: PEGA domain-containing protein [Sandaracinaceae bacterium]
MIASQLFEQAQAAIRLGRLRDCARLYLSSYELVPNPNALFNAASCLDEIPVGRRARDRTPEVDAYNLYESFRRTGVDDPAILEQLDRRQEALARRLAVLDVETDPPGAELYALEERLGLIGVSPRRVAFNTYKAAQGEYGSVLIVRLAGHEDARVAVEPTRGEITPLRLELVPVVGTLVIRSDPPGATVSTADGEVLGTTPLDITYRVGRHELRVHADGYVDERRSATVRPNATTELPEVVLAEALSRVVRLSVLGEPDGAAVWVNDRELGAVPYAGTLRLSGADGFERGEARLEVRMDGHLPWSAAIVLQPGTSGVARVDLALDRVDRAAWRCPLYVTVGLLAIAAIAAGSVAIWARNQFNGSPNPDPSLLDTRNRAAITADVLGATALVTFGLTLTFDLLRASPPTSTGTFVVE